MEKRLIGLFCLACLFLWACGGSSTDESKVPVPPSSTFMVRNYNFCSPESTDRFLVGYYGQEVTDTLVYFYIVSSHGDTLHQDHWPATELVSGQSKQDSDAVMEAMKAMIDVKPNDATVCDVAGKSYSYVGRTIGFCPTDKSVVKL